MKRSFLSLTILTFGLTLSSNFSGLVKFSDDGVYAQETSNVLNCLSNFSDSKDIVGCLRSIMNDQTQSPDERYSAHYHLANTYYLDGKYINSYSSLNDDLIKTDPSGYRKALSYLLRAENEVLLGEYGKAKKSLTEVFNLINPEPKKEKVNLTQDELVTFHLLRGNIYTATAQKLSLDEEKDKKLSDEKEAKSFYKSARSIIVQKFIGLADQPKQENSPYPNRIYCKPLEYDQNEIPKSLDNNILEPFRSLAKKGELDLNDYDKASFKKNAKIGDLFKLLEAVVSLSKNQTYQREFNNQVFDNKRVIQGSYIYDLKCYVNLISSANNFPKEEKTNDPRVEALFYNYLGEAYEELADKNIDPEENYLKAKDYYGKSSDTKYEYIKILSLKNLADLYKKNGQNQDAIFVYKQIVSSLEKTVSDTANLTLVQKQFVEENKLDVYKNLISLLWDDSSKSEDVIKTIERSRISSEAAKKPTYNSCLPSSSNDNDVISRLQCLPEKTTLIEYFVAKDDKVYAVVINKQNKDDKYTIELPIAKKYLGMEKELTSQIEQFYQYDLTAGVQACQQSDGKSDQLCQPQSLGKLYDILIKPIKHQIKTTNLIIVPHRILHNLPFAALYDSQNKQYLTEKYAISVLPSIYSLATISHSKNSVEDPKDIRIVALANPTFDLLNSQLEVQAIQDIKSSEKSNEKLYKLDNPLYGKNATLEKLKDELNIINPAPRILHLSTHNTPDKEFALNTALSLYGGQLAKKDIDQYPNMNQVNLVVLSACQTNVGEITKGDAVFNLTNSFLDNGVSSVVSSLWNVDDEATSKLMKNFYTELAHPGTTKAEALQNAQVQLLKDEKTGEFRHPYYWGAFLLTGDSSPLIGK